MTDIDPRLAAAEALDRAYAEAEAFDARRAAEAARMLSRTRAEAFARLKPGSPEWLALDEACAEEDAVMGEGPEDWDRIAGDRR